MNSKLPSPNSELSMSLFSARKISGSIPPTFVNPLDSSPLAVDVFRAKDKLVILAPIAGVKIEDITVSISDDVLTISGERSEIEKVSRHDYFSQECSWGSFERSVVLPVSVDINKIAAFYKNGILRIEMPILEEDRSRVIPIRLQED